MSQIHAITDTTFEKEVIESTIPVVVDFWAPWCGPCKSLAPIIDDVSTKYPEKVKFVKLDVDQNSATPPKFGVRGIPTLILFKNGQVAATHVGLLNKADLTKFIDDHI